MNLPHKDPLIFAKKIIEKNENSATVFCSFDQTPTLAMFLEAAAQSTIAFSKEEEIKIGFLTSAQNIKLHNKLKQSEYIIQVKKEIEVANMKKFYFESFENLNCTPCVEGFITIIIKE